MDLLNELTNVHYVNPVYNWDMILKDKDDNKFVDCAVAGYSDFIVSEDHHFDILKSIEFPQVAVIGIDEFIKKIRNI